MAKTTKIRVRLRSYDHVNLDASAERIVTVAKKEWCPSRGTSSAPNGKTGVYNFKITSQAQRFS